MQYLFGAHIGPVQPFIAYARRTRDLYSGSTLVSEVSKAVARTIKEKCGMQHLIFPSPNTARLEDIIALDQGSPFNVSNKVIAIIPDPYTPEEIGLATKAEIDRLLKEIANRIFQRIGDNQSFNREIAEEQILNSFEYYWVAVPFEGLFYEQPQKKLEVLLTARKNTRDYDKVTWGTHTPKSSIDGQMESIIPEYLYPKRRSFKHGAEHENVNSRRLFLQFRAGPAERLSGIDLLKRRGTIKESDIERGFPSTSHMATIPYLRCLDHLLTTQQAEAKRLWENYIEIVPGIGKDDDRRDARGKEQAVVEVLERVSGYPSSTILNNYDGGMLFQERLLQDVVNQPNFATAQEKLQKFFEYINNCFGQPLKPGTYYAILMADGDNMGKMIKHLIQNTDLPEGLRRHQSLSRTLSDFARQSEEIIKAHQGASVYHGGDDIIALLPLHTALDCAAKLADAFRTSMKRHDNEHPPTLSVGIAIVHHLALLQDALSIARRAERAAKNIEGKNALAIILSKRSGEDYTITRKWQEVNAHLDTDQHLQKLIQYCREKLIPGGTAYEIRDSTQRLTALDIPPKTGETSIMDVLQADTKRILKRKLFVPHTRTSSTNGSTSIEDRNVKTQALLASLMEHITMLQTQLSHHQQPPKAEKVFEQFINELIIAQELADAITLSETTPQKES